MRLLIRLVLFVAVLWCGWWALASYGVSRGVDAWVEARRAEGWEIEAQTTQGGFPLNIQTQVSALSLSNPVAGTALHTQGGTVSARTYWPGYLDLDLPNTPILFNSAAGQVKFEVMNGGAQVRLRPGTSLELGSLQIASDGFQLGIDDITLVQGHRLTLNADQDAETAQTYAVSLDADQLAPGALPRQLLGLPEDWPLVFDSFAATGAVTLDAPLSRASFEGAAPQFRQITLESATIIWGAISLNASGALDVDVTGVPDGAVTVQARDWRGLLDLAQGAGVLPDRQRGQADLMLGMLAARNGDPQDLDLVLTFQDGQMALNGIALGPAPKLILR